MKRWIGFLLFLVMAMPAVAGELQVLDWGMSRAEVEEYYNEQDRGKATKQYVQFVGDLFGAPGAASYFFDKSGRMTIQMLDMDAKQFQPIYNQYRQGYGVPVPIKGGYLWPKIEDGSEITLKMIQGRCALILKRNYKDQY